MCQIAHTWCSYSKALECPTSVEENKTIRLNRALANLKTKQFDAALIDTGCLSSLSEPSEKALYRAGQALYQLERFQECRDVLTTLCERYPNNSLAIDLLGRVGCRLEEQKTGTYNFESILQEVSIIRPPHLDHATFVGPVVIKESAGRGRGLFTTEAVKAGQLVLCEKAFAHCYANKAEPESSSEITLLADIDTKRMFIGTQGDLNTIIVQKLWHNPSLRDQFTSLYRGSYQTVKISDVDNTPIIDT